MNRFFVIDANPIVLVFLSFVLLLVYANIRLLLRMSETVFLFCCSLTLTLIRLPVILSNREFNMDESQMITQAHTLWHFPAFWDYVDGTTSGPLNSYVLFLGRLITGNFDFTSARVTSIILIIITLTTLYQALKLLFDLRSARMSVTLIILFYSFNQLPDFVHYSSETLSLAFIGTSLWLMALIWKEKGTLLTGFVLGFVLMLIPFAKIQALPIAFFLGCYSLTICFISNDRKLVSSIVTGAVCCALIVAILLQVANLWGDFWTFYIQGNFAYGETFYWEEALRLSAKRIWDGEGLFVLVVLVAMFWIASKVFGRKTEKPRLTGLFILSFVSITIFCIVKPGMFFSHYYLFLMPVFGFILANAFSSLAGAIDGSKGAIAKIVWGIAVFSMGANLWCFNYGRYGILNKYPTTSLSVAKNPVVEEIMKHSEPCSFLAIWGWWPAGYVQSGMIQATAENHPVRGLIGNSLSPLYLDRYLRNLARTQPALFVDPVGSSYNFAAVHPSDFFENTPSIRNYIDAHYGYLKTVEDVRIYLRKDLISTSAGSVD